MIKDEKGQSLLEFALVVPIILLLICGIFDFGRLLYAYAHLHMGAQEAVRLGGLGKSDVEITSFAQDYVHLSEDQKVRVVVTPNDHHRHSGQYVTVKLEYSFSLITPIISKIIPDQVIVAQSTIRIE